MKTYQNENLRHIAYPLGGIGAGMFCVQGNGMFGNFSLRGEPNVAFEPNVFSAIYVKNVNAARIVEGQIPFFKVFGGQGGGPGFYDRMGNGLGGKNYGLPRFKTCDFTAKFPFAELNFTDETLPITAALSCYSPFIPGDSDNSSLPVASATYTFKNTSNETVEAVYSFNAVNFMKDKPNHEVEDIAKRGRVYQKDNGFILSQPALKDVPAAVGDFYAAIEGEDISVNAEWFDGGWYDTLTMLWNDIKTGCVKSGEQANNQSPGGSISVPFTLNPGEEKSITVRFAWYVPNTILRNGFETDGESCCCKCDKGDKPTHKPWYSAKFSDVEGIMTYFSDNYNTLYNNTKLFSDTFYQTDLPEVIIDAVAANLTIFKSPTILRQTDGRIWAWEGCCDSNGCCSGSCTHVWNYAQSMCHLFPELERTLRFTEFNENQDERGHQEFRASLPIRKAGNKYHAASDGQLGGIVKMYREWKISGDNNFLESNWDKMVDSIDYCIETWDNKREGVLKEPHHNTYDIEFWGADGMCSSFYLGALKAISLMGEVLNKDVTVYKHLFESGKAYLETRLYNGEYFYQETEWETLEAKMDLSEENEYSINLMAKEGPKYQYGKGCISDGVLGAWMAQVCGVGEILDHDKVASHLQSVYRYNYRTSLLEHENPQRPGYALGNEGGLLLCSWPRGEKPSLPFVYSDEVWTGIEYQVASHLISYGYEEEGLNIVKTLRARYDGTKRNPFNEYECGHWYARAMASYALLEAYSGVRYDAVSKTLYGEKKPFKSFLATATGYGIAECDGTAMGYHGVSGDVTIDNIVMK